MDMGQVQLRSSMQAVEEAPRMLVGMRNAPDIEDLLFLFSFPGADWSRIPHRICLILS